MIVRVPNSDLAYGVLAAVKMKMFAPKTSNSEYLISVAEAINLEYRDNGGAVEIGHRPQSPQTSFTYLTWEWDDDLQEYSILTWRGGRWSR